MTDAATKTAKLILDDKTFEMPVVVGTQQEHAIDIEKLRSSHWPYYAR